MSSSVIGQPVTRDRRTAESQRPALRMPWSMRSPTSRYGVGVASTIGNGRIKRIDTADAEHMPGVLAILHHGNIGQLYRPANNVRGDEQARRKPPAL